MPELSIIVPARNESASLQELFERIGRALENADIRYEIIFIDSHSTDNSYQLAKSYQSQYNIKPFHQKNFLGKAGAILEGIGYAESNYVVMIDSDLQYPPEAIPNMYSMRIESPVVVANRLNYRESIVRKFFSRSFHFLFSKLLFGFDCDVQSGLKLFPKKLASYVDSDYITPWTFDLSLLYAAQQLKINIGSLPIEFARRFQGETKVNIIGSVKEHLISCVRFKLNPPPMKSP